MTDTLVAFLDILGCDAIALHGTAHEQNNIVAFLKRINQTYLSKQGTIIRDLGIGQQIIHNPEVFTCSDSILLSVEVSDSADFSRAQTIDNFMSTMVSIFWQGLQAGLLIRGGITRGECIHEGSLIFGEAYARAVRLEKQTMYPRIAFDDGVFDSALPPVMSDERKALCTKEVAGHLFLNCLAWHQGVWRDYFYFKYGESDWPEGQIQETEIRQAIEDIQSITASQLSALTGDPLEKWAWFNNQWNQEKACWPIFD